VLQNKLKRRLLVNLLAGTVLLGLICLPAAAEEHLAVEPSPELLSALQQGGFVFYLRHGPTDTSIPDQVPVDFNDCSSQRPLSEEGRQVMQEVAQHMARHAWPVEDPILVSPFCRAKETAQIVLGTQPYEVDELLRYTAAMTDDEKRPVVEHTGKMLSLPVEGNANRMIVAHGPNLADLMDYFPPEGTLVIFSPLDEEGYLYHASIPPDLWTSLAFEAP
jgi:phosphohistidine phosphatase SixA